MQRSISLSDLIRIIVNPLFRLIYKYFWSFKGRLRTALNFHIKLYRFLKLNSIILIKKNIKHNLRSTNESMRYTFIYLFFFQNNISLHHLSSFYSIFIALSHQKIITTEKFSSSRFNYA